MNYDELGELVDGFSLNENNSSVNRLQQIFRSAQPWLHQFGLRCVWVTDGANGAYFIGSNAEPVFEPAVEPGGLVDTVGARDAFSSAVSHG